MAITQRATSTGNPFGASVSFNLPTGTVADDVTVFIGAFAGATVAGSVTIPAGWTTIFNANGTFAFYRKFVVGDPSSITLTSSDTANFWSYAAVSKIGCDTTTPVDVFNNNILLANAQATLNAPSVAPTFTNDLLLACYSAIVGLSGTWTTPAGFASVIAATGGPTCLIAQKQLSSAAQTGSVASTAPHTNQPIAGVQIALHAAGDTPATQAAPIMTLGGTLRNSGGASSFTPAISKIGPQVNDLKILCLSTVGATTATATGWTVQGQGNGNFTLTRFHQMGDTDPLVTLSGVVTFVYYVFIVRANNFALATIDQVQSQAGSGSPSLATLGTLTPAHANEYAFAFWGSGVGSGAGTWTAPVNMTTEINDTSDPQLLICDTQPASVPTGTFAGSNSNNATACYATELLITPPAGAVTATTGAMVSIIL